MQAQLVGKTAAADRVYTTRQVPWAASQLPGIAIYALEEPVDPESRKRAPRELTRNLRLVIEGAVEATVNVDDAMDDLAEQIERAIDADRYFAGTAHDSILTSTSLGVAAEGRREVGAVLLTYTVTYFTDAPSAVDVPLPDDFATAGITTDLSGSTDPGNQAQDVVAIPTT